MSDWDQLVDELDHLRAENNRLRKDAALGKKLEGIIAARTHFTGEAPYVGRKGVILALNEALDELHRLRKCRDENKIFMKALEFYANYVNWEGLVKVGLDYFKRTPRAHEDAGTRARAALREAADV